MPESPERSSSRHVLEAFQRALSQELHVLQRRPHQIWQQLFNRLPSAAGDETLKVWDAQTGRPVREIATSIKTCDYSPDGKRIVSAGNEWWLKIWDIETWEVISSLKIHSGAVNACAYSPDGRNIVSASQDKTLKIWDARTGATIATFAGHTNEVEACAYTSSLVTPAYVYRFDIQEFDVESSAKCDSCGRRSPTPPAVLDAIKSIGRDANLAQYDSPCAKLPDEAWDDPRLFSECASCRRPIRFNPFIVDNRDRY